MSKFSGKFRKNSDYMEEDEYHYVKTKTKSKRNSNEYSVAKKRRKPWQSDHQKYDEDDSRYYG